MQNKSYKETEDFSIEELLKGNKDRVDNHVCPHCGRCPKCGRRYNDYEWPYYPWPYRPQPYTPYWYGSSSGTIRF